MQYWIIKDGESKGPFTLEELQAMGISETTKIWCKGMDNWTKAGETDIADVLFAPVGNEPTESAVIGLEGYEVKSNEEPAAEEPVAEEPVAVEESATEEPAAEEPVEEPVAAEEPAAEEPAAEQPQMTPPPYNPAHYNPPYNPAPSNQPPYVPQQQPMPGYGPQPSSQQIYNEGYRRGLEDGKKLDADTDTSKCPPSNMVWAVLATVLCCMPVGIVSIVYSCRVGSLYAKGDFVGAKRASDRAAYWALGSAIVHMVTYPITSALSLMMM